MWFKDWVTNSCLWDSLRTLKRLCRGSRRPQGRGSGSSRMGDRSWTGMVSTELTVPDVDEDWLAGTDDELELL